MSDSNDSVSFKSHRFVAIQIWIISILVCISVYFLCTIWYPPDPLILKGDELVGVAYQAGSNGFSGAQSGTFLLSMKGGVFFKNGGGFDSPPPPPIPEPIPKIISINGYFYLGKVNLSAVEKLKRLVLDNDIRRQTYEDNRTDHSRSTLELYFKSGRVVHQVLYGASKNANFSIVKYAMEEIVFKKNVRHPIGIRESEVDELRSIFKISEK